MDKRHSCSDVDAYGSGTHNIADGNVQSQVL